MKLWPFAFLSLSFLANASDLNIKGFAGCLGSSGVSVDLSSLRSQYRFSDFDLLLFYLAAYPGEKLPGVPASLQNQANQKWGVAFESESLSLASDFVATPPHTPLDAYRSALQVCAEDVFCAAITTQNVLRTFGRYDAEVNPEWFSNSQAQWVAAIPRIQSTMISLRQDGEGADQLGDWYHVFGILSYAIDAKSLGHSQSSVQEIVGLNDRLDKQLTGNTEDPVKAQIDQDAVSVSWDYLAGGSTGTMDCSTVQAYVNN